MPSPFSRPLVYLIFSLVLCTSLLNTTSVWSQETQPTANQPKVEAAPTLHVHTAPDAQVEKDSIKPSKDPLSTIGQEVQDKTVKSTTPPQLKKKAES